MVVIGIRTYSGVSIRVIPSAAIQRKNNKVNMHNIVNAKNLIKNRCQGLAESINFCNKKTPP